MEFNLLDIDQIMMNLSNEPSTQDQHDSDSSLVTLKNNESFTSNDSQDESTIMEHDQNRQYCLIIFSNPKWSQILRKRSEHVV